MLNKNNVIYCIRNEKEYEWFLQNVLPDANLLPSIKFKNMNRMYVIIYDGRIYIEEKNSSEQDIPTLDLPIINVSELINAKPYAFKIAYINYMNSYIEQTQITSDTYRLTIPVLDSHNDMIEIYIQNKSGEFIITDGGMIVSEIINFDSKILTDSVENYMMHQRQRVVTKLLNQYNINISEKNIAEITTSKENLSINIIKFIQCIQAISWINEIYCK